MAKEKAPYTAATGRKFAFTLAVAFAVLAAIAFLRHRQLTWNVLGGLAALMSVLGIAVPSRLEPVERAWMGLAHVLSKITTPIFMGIVYFVVLTPTAFVRRMAGGNPMTHKLEADSYWAKREPVEPEAGRERMERQF